MAVWACRCGNVTRRVSVPTLQCEQAMEEAHARERQARADLQRAVHLLCLHDLASVLITTSVWMCRALTLGTHLWHPYQNLRLELWQRKHERLDSAAATRTKLLASMGLTSGGSGGDGSGGSGSGGGVGHIRSSSSHSSSNSVEAGGGAGAGGSARTPSPLHLQLDTARVTGRSSSPDPYASSRRSSNGVLDEGSADSGLGRYSYTTRSATADSDRL